MKAKICGITTAQEAEYLNESKADYAGLVLYEKSKRSITLQSAVEVMDFLDPAIKRVAVMVSPFVSDLLLVEDAGFQILQVHKELRRELLEQASIPIWYAISLSERRKLMEAVTFLEELPKTLQSKITGIVVDGADFGGGKTFDWEQTKAEYGSLKNQIGGRQLILAGGLTPENVSEGMRLFTPDVVDVSTGVEYEDLETKDTRKSPKKIKQFMGKVREYE